MSEPTVVTRNTNRRRSHLLVRALCEGGILIALSLVLGMIKVFELPQGGSISLEMLPLLLFCVRWGVGWGFLGCFAFGVLQVFIQGAVSYGWQSILLDYVLAFTLLGLAGAIAKPFANRMAGVAVGTAAVCALRFLCSFLSGVLIWGNLSDGLPAWIYSLTYNGSYMLPETILTTVAAVLIYKAAPQLFAAQQS